MDERLEARFGVVHGYPTVGVAAPYDRAGLFLVTAVPLCGDSTVFTYLLPALEEVQSGRRESVSASSELVELEASAAGVVLTEEGVAPACVVPLGAFVDLLWQWWGHVEAVQAALAPRA